MLDPAEPRKHQANRFTQLALTKVTGQMGFAVAVKPPVEQAEHRKRHRELSRDRGRARAAAVAVSPPASWSRARGWRGAQGTPRVFMRGAQRLGGAFLWFLSLCEQRKKPARGAGTAIKFNTRRSREARSIEFILRRAQDERREVGNDYEISVHAGSRSIPNPFSATC